MSEDVEELTSFENHVLSVFEKRESAINRAMWIESGIVFIPMMVFLMLFAWLVNEFGAITGFLVLVVAFMATYFAWDRIKDYYVDQLRGKKIWAMTLRLRKGASITDWFVLKNPPVPIPKKVSENVLKGMNLEKVALDGLNLYLVEFEDCEYFDKMIMLSPCPIEELLVPTTQQMIYKNFFVQAEISMLSVVRLREFKMGPEGIIPVVYPIDSDYEAEKLQATMHEEILRKGLSAVVASDKIYDSYKYLETLNLMESTMKELKSLAETHHEIDKKAARMAYELAEDILETNPEKKPSSWRKGLKFLKDWRFWAVVVIVGIVLFVLFGGHILG
jgi:hypothetical protein